MVVAEFTVIPLAGTDMRPYVDAAVEAIRRSGLKYEVGALGTTIEGELEAVFRVMQEAHQAVIAKGAGRVITEMRLDDRRDAEVSIEREVSAYRERHLYRAGH